MTKRDRMEQDLEALLGDLNQRIERAKIRVDRLANAAHEFEATSLPTPRNEARLDRWNDATRRAEEIQNALEVRRDAAKALHTVLEEQRWKRERRRQEARS